MLYGSRARGDAGPESDHDVAVFLTGITDAVEDLYQLADIGTDLIYESGRVMHAFP